MGENSLGGNNDPILLCIDFDNGMNIYRFIEQCTMLHAAPASNMSFAIQNKEQSAQRSAVQREATQSQQTKNQQRTYWIIKISDLQAIISSEITQRKESAPKPNSPLVNDVRSNDLDKNI